MSLIPWAFKKSFPLSSTVAALTGACKQQMLRDEEQVLLPELAKSTKIVPNKGV
jgi:hypothetical protein